MKHLRVFKTSVLVFFALLSAAAPIAELADIPNVCGVKIATQNVGDVLDTTNWPGIKLS